MTPVATAPTGIGHLAEDRLRTAARRAFGARLRRLSDHYRSREPCERWLPFTSMAIIVGAAGAGTRLLYEALRRHPQIAENTYTPEPHFFGRPRFAGGVDRFHNGWPWYLAQWDFDPERHRYALEASPSYTEYPAFDASFGRMKTMPIDYRFIYVLRDPIERLEAQLARSLARGRGRPAARELLGERPIGASCYALQIDRIVAHFRREELLLLPYTELRSDPARAVARALRFLGLTPIAETAAGDAEATDAAPWRESVRWLADDPGPVLTEHERALVYREIAGDLARLRDVYGFPTYENFPTVARIASVAGA